MQIGADIKAEHQSLGIAKNKAPRKVHKSTAALLAVPRYSDLLGDQDDEDEDERGRMLISSKQGWRTDMARWIGAARDADAAEEIEDAENALNSTPARPDLVYKCVTLAALFGRPDATPTRIPAAEIAAEAALMEALADLDEDERPDEGAIEIQSEDEYMG